MFELPEIEVNIDIGGIWNELGQYCPHLSYNRGAIGINVTQRQEFMNCNKVLLKNFWDVEGVYKGKYAKYIDECYRSQAGSSDSDDPQVTQTIWETDWAAARQERVLFGTVDPASASNCINLPLVSAPASLNKKDVVTASGELAWHNLYKQVFNYFWNLQNRKVHHSNTYSLF